MSICCTQLLALTVNRYSYRLVATEFALMIDLITNKIPLLFLVTFHISKLGFKTPFSKLIIYGHSNRQE